MRTGNLSRYYFIVGVLLLLVVPFLTWFHYGLNFGFPSDVSLVYLYGRGFRGGLVLYLTGVAASVAVVAALRRPVFFQGVLPAVFPAWTVTTSLFPSLYYGYPAVGFVLTDGILVALLGSVLLEASYFSFRRGRPVISDR